MLCIKKKQKRNKTCPETHPIINDIKVSPTKCRKNHQKSD